MCYWDQCAVSRVPIRLVSSLLLEIGFAGRIAASFNMGVSVVSAKKARAERRRRRLCQRDDSCSSCGVSPTQRDEVTRMSELLRVRLARLQQLGLLPRDWVGESSEVESLLHPPSETLLTLAMDELETVSAEAIVLKRRLHLDRVVRSDGPGRGSTSASASEQPVSAKDS